MQQLLTVQSFDSVGKPNPLRGATGSTLVHVVAIAILLSMPYWQEEVLPARFTQVLLVAPSPPPPPLPPAPEIKVTAARVIRTARAFSPVLTAPVAIPEHAVVGLIEAPPEMEVIGGVPGGIPGGVPGGIPGGLISALPAPPPPPPPQIEAKPIKPPEPQAPSRVQIDSEIQAAKLLYQVQPEYPLPAKQARIQGVVHLTAIISPEGRITELKAIDGNPLLVQAARNAVEKWRYSPTILHGQAVEVVTSIAVKFHLN